MLFPMGALPQPDQTILSVSAQILPTLQTPSLLLPLSALGAQVPERNKEHCTVLPAGMLIVLKDKYFPIQHLLHLKILYSRINLKVPFKKIINNLI